MSQLADQLNKVLDKTERLLELCAALQEENDLLNLENQSLTSALSASKNKTAELEEKLRVVKTASLFTDGNSQSNEKNLDIKQKINDFVQEIDKCIVLLKK